MLKELRDSIYAILRFEEEALSLEQISGLLGEGFSRPDVSLALSRMKHDGEISEVHYVWELVPRSTVNIHTMNYTVVEKEIDDPTSAWINSDGTIPVEISRWGTKFRLRERKSND